MCVGNLFFFILKISDSSFISESKSYVFFFFVNFPWTELLRLQMSHLICKFDKCKKKLNLEFSAESLHELYNRTDLVVRIVDNSDWSIF